MRKILLYLLPLCLLSTTLFASLNVTYLNTTVILNKSTSAEVVETLLINISNGSVSTYLGDREGINLTLSGWSAVLHTNLLIQHIFNPESSISSFELLPGPIINQNSRGAQAYLTMRYVAHNISTVQNVGPRKFEYTMNGTALNFAHSAGGGESLTANSRFNIIIPKGTELISVYPEPDSPFPNFLGTYNNDTSFSWDQSEPLSKFQFSYIVTESLQDEVTAYFSTLYSNYTQQIYLAVIILLGIASVFVYAKVFV